MGRKGFTLIELTMVIIVIALLAAIAIPQYMSVRERGIASAAKAKLDIVRKAEGVYHSIYSTYRGLADADSPLKSEVKEADTALLDDRDWAFTSSSGYDTFIITATRNIGSEAANTITVNEEGQFAGTHKYASD